MADESDIVHCSPVMFNDPWKSDETSHFIIVKIDGNREENINP